jgi:hypothetical protein
MEEATKKAKEAVAEEIARGRTPVAWAPLEVQPQLKEADADGDGWVGGDEAGQALGAMKAEREAGWMLERLTTKGR